ncbi:MAG: flagellar basal body-associated FliL family protein [Alphaproteobacteria bacterium]|nr:flagellar basal body-associated FliL family protein [Alphaproteobacteria bacterium]
MEHNENRIIRFYIGSFLLITALAVFGFVVADRIVAAERAQKAIKTQLRANEPDMAYIGLPRVNVSFSGASGMQMQLDLALEVEPRYAEVVEGYIPKVVDRLNAYFPKAKLDSLDRAHAMFLLRKDMLWEVNQVGIPVPVNDVLIQNLVVQ